MRGVRPQHRIDKGDTPAEHPFGSVSEPQQAQRMAQCTVLNPKCVEDGGSLAWGFRAPMGKGSVLAKEQPSVGCWSQAPQDATPVERWGSEAHLGWEGVPVKRWPSTGLQPKHACHLITEHLIFVINMACDIPTKTYKTQSCENTKQTQIEGHST